MMVDTIPVALQFGALGLLALVLLGIGGAIIWAVRWFPKLLELHRQEIEVIAKALDKNSKAITRLAKKVSDCCKRSEENEERGEDQ